MYFRVTSVLMPKPISLPQNQFVTLILEQYVHICCCIPGENESPIKFLWRHEPWTLSRWQSHIQVNLTIFLFTSISSIHYLLCAAWVLHFSHLHHLSERPTIEIYIYISYIWYVCIYSYWCVYDSYRQVSSIRRTLVGNKIVDNSDVVGASPVGAAPTTSSLST